VTVSSGVPFRDLPAGASYTRPLPWAVRARKTRRRSRALSLQCEAAMSDSTEGMRLLEGFKGPDPTPFKKAEGILYHYCSNTSFLSIVSNQTIRASEYSLSNDGMEGNGFAKSSKNAAAREGFRLLSLEWY
jgi:hypothetical protein